MAPLLCLPPAVAPSTALVLAAGRGERMRPLTDHTPKPLLQVRGQSLLHWHLAALQRAGVASATLNTDWLGAQLEAAVGPRFGSMDLLYSREGQDFGGALETAGGIARARPLLAPVFWVLAGDVFVPDFVFAPEALVRFAQGPYLAHLWLVPNPAHNPRGDFGLADGLARNLGTDSAAPSWTFSTIGLYRRELFDAPWCPIATGNPEGQRAALAPLLRTAMDAERVSAELYTGAWTDVGTPARLAALNAL